MKKHGRAIAVAAAVLVVGLAVGVGGSSAGTSGAEAASKQLVKNAAAAHATAKWKTVSVGVGRGVVKVKGPIHLAYFAPGENNSWLQAAIKGAKDAIKKIPGSTITVFDPNWNATAQFNEVQTALQSGKYNAALIDPVNSQLMCKIMTTTAPQKGVLVANITHPLCNKYYNGGVKRWSPGTLTYVDANDTVGEMRAYLTYMAKTNPGPQELVAISGPPADGMTKNIERAVAQLRASKKFPKFKVVKILTTDFSLTQAQSQLSSLLQANPNISIVWSPATSDVTRGAYAAILGANRTDKIKLYEKGGSSWVVQMVKKGAIVGTQPQYPYSNTYVAVQQLLKAFRGKKVSRFIPDYGKKYNAADRKRGFQLFTRENIKSYKPEY